jgi:hypothetical protein
MGSGTASAASPDEQVIVSLELSTLAPASIVQVLHDRANDDWLATIFPEFAPADRDMIRMMAIERTARGLRIRIDLKPDAGQTARFRVPVEASLEQLAQSLPRPYSYSMKERKENAPSQPPARFPWPWLAGLGGLGLLALLLAWKRRPAFLSQPHFGGLPLAGALPAGLGLGGKFLELQSAPCQTMGVMVRELALAERARSGEKREHEGLAIASTGDPASAAVVAAALGISLVRDGKRVLVVDLLAEDSVLAEVLEESDSAEPLMGTGDLAALNHTGIPDLDLMTANLGPDGDLPPLPPAVTQNYDWTLLVHPDGCFIPGMPTFPVFSGPTSRLTVWRERLAAWRQKAPLLGAILVGVPLPDEVRERMLARSYFERIRALENVAP